MNRVIFGTVAAAAILAGATAQARDVTIGMQLEPPHLDPTSAAAGAIDQVLYSNVFEGLTRFSSDGSVGPGLAESWEISEDGLTYTFTLRSGVKFHDGTDLDATDVTFSLDRARAEDSVNAQKALFANIASTEAVDATTVKVTLTNPQGNFLFNMAWGDAVIVAPESIENIKSNPVGTGAFTFADWKQGDAIILKKNDNYWWEPAKLDGATFKFISDPTAAFAAMMAEDIDAFYVYPAPENLAQFEADPRFTVLAGNTEGETHFAPHNPAYVDLTGNSNYDPEKAKALLAAAGFADGFTTTLKLPPPSYARRGGEIIAAQLREVGIETEIANLEWAQWLEQAFKGYDFGLTIVSHTEPMDIGIYARPEYYFQYDNPAFQRLIADLDAENDPEKRTGMMQEAQTIISEDFVNVYLFQLAQTSVVNAKLKGIWPDAPTQAVDLTAVYWDE